MLRLRVAFKNHRLIVPVQNPKILISDLIKDLEVKFSNHLLSEYQLNHKEEKEKHIKIYDLMTEPHQVQTNLDLSKEYLYSREDVVENVMRDGDYVRAVDLNTWIDYQVSHFCDRKRAWIHLERDNIFGEIGYHKKNKVYCLFGNGSNKQYFEFSIEDLKAMSEKKAHEIGIAKDYKGLWYVCAKFELPTSEELKDDKKMLCEMSIHLKPASEEEKVYIHQVSVHEKNGHLLKGPSRFF